MSDDARLLDPAGLGDHVDRLYRAAWALCGSREDAEDLVQETFARVLAKPRLLHRDDDLGYLLRVLRNTFVSRHRAAGRLGCGWQVGHGFPGAQTLARRGSIPAATRARARNRRLVMVASLTPSTREASAYRTRQGARSAYTIVDGAPLDPPERGAVQRVGGVAFTIVTGARETVVVWEEGGHTCVLSAPAGVRPQRLVELAAWRPQSA